jgi:hypothetical protein
MPNTMDFETWKSKLEELLGEAGLKPRELDAEMLFMAWDMEEKTPEEVVEDVRENLRNME